MAGEVPHRPFAEAQEKEGENEIFQLKLMNSVRL